jgi:hypothetical protein
MIELNSEAGKQAKENLAILENKENLKVINPNRGLLVYQWHQEYIRCNVAWPRTVEDPNKPWYAMLLDVGHHFEAMSAPEQNLS